MPSESVITQEMRESIGVEYEPVTHEVEKGSIIKFAQAIEDSNPIYNDEEAGRQSRYGGLIAPPTFIRSLDESPTRVQVVSPYPAFLDGGSQWEYFEPVRPGDRITLTVKIADIFERQGRLGNMLFVISESRYVNQSGKEVATQRGTDIWYRPAENQP